LFPLSLHVHYRISQYKENCDVSKEEFCSVLKVTHYSSIIFTLEENTGFHVKERDTELTGEAEKIDIRKG
jgi:hypothetical protein